MNGLKICGLQKTTLLDYPGHVAATVFLGGCNFRCPFCQNGEILGNDAEPQYTSEDVLSFLKKRCRILEGVCITGGEPTLQPEALIWFLQEIRGLGLRIKLDTNGARPSVVRHLAEQNLLDYVAMDIKAGPDHYPVVCGLKSDDITAASVHVPAAANDAASAADRPLPAMDGVRETVQWLKDSGIDYEFRTTAVKGLHTQEDFAQIGPWIAGCPRYFIQNYAASERVLKPDGLQPFSKEELLSFAEMVNPYVRQVCLRGIDY